MGEERRLIQTEPRGHKSSKSVKKARTQQLKIESGPKEQKATRNVTSRDENQATISNVARQNREKESNVHATKKDTKLSDRNAQNQRPHDINWPKSNSDEWKRLDEDASKRLKIIIASPEDLAESHPRVIFNMVMERFGVKERKANALTGPSRRQKHITNLRAEIKLLDKAVKSA